MTEERKYAILFAAALLSARSLIENIEGSKPKIERTVFYRKSNQESGVRSGTDRPRVHE
jgi:hypothetical protein